MKHILVFKCLHHYVHPAVSSVIFQDIRFHCGDIWQQSHDPIKQIALNLSVKTVSETGDIVFALLSSHVLSVGVIQQNKMCEEPSNSTGCDYCTTQQPLPPFFRTDYMQEAFLLINIYFSISCFFKFSFECVWLWGGKRWSLQLLLLN